MRSPWPCTVRTSSLVPVVESLRVGRQQDMRVGKSPFGTKDEVGRLIYPARPCVQVMTRQCDDVHGMLLWEVPWSGLSVR